MIQELYDAVLDQLFEHVGYKCQPSELEELADELVKKVAEILREEFR